MRAGFWSWRRVDYPEEPSLDACPKARVDGRILPYPHRGYGRLWHEKSRAGAWRKLRDQVIRVRSMVTQIDLAEQGGRPAQALKRRVFDTFMAESREYRKVLSRCTGVPLSLELKPLL